MTRTFLGLALWRATTHDHKCKENSGCHVHDPPGTAFGECHDHEWRMALFSFCQDLGEDRFYIFVSLLSMQVFIQVEEQPNHK